MIKQVKYVFLILDIIIYCILPENISAQQRLEAVRLKANDILSSVPSPAIKIEGLLGDKINLCIDNRVMAQSIEKIIYPFRLRFENDFGGF